MTTLDDSRPATMADLRWFADQVNKRIDDIRFMIWMLWLFQLAVLAGVVTIAVAVLG